jgi:hypothetical protein
MVVAIIAVAGVALGVASALGGGLVPKKRIRFAEYGAVGNYRDLHTREFTFDTTTPRKRRIARKYAYGYATAGITSSPGLR